MITRAVFDPIFWSVKRLPVLPRYSTYQHDQWDDVETFQARQDKKLAALLHHAAGNVLFYQSRIKGDMMRAIDNNPRSVLEMMPVLTKSDLRDSAVKMFVDMGRGTFRNSSGGSTGQPVVLYQDADYQASSLASTLLLYEWAGMNRGDSHALLWGAERDLVRGGLGLRRILADFIGNRITLNAFRLSPDRMRDYVARINRFKPVCIEGYAECLYQFAQFVERNNFPVAAPKTIVSSAGTLFPVMRQQIESTFRTVVFDRYGSREVGNMAAECDHHEGLHVFGETCIVEVVDNNGGLVQEGEEGEVLVTSLTNFTMPLIRYQIGDRAVLGKSRCSCGRPYPMLEKIAGRSGASIATEDGGVVSPEFFIHLIGVMHNDGNIGKFQVVQEALDHLVVRLVPAPGADLTVWPHREVLVNHIRKVVGEQCRVDIRFEKDIEPTATGKHLYTINRIGQSGC
jgi:phenylacetate-CoA ligase